MGRARWVVATAATLLAVVGGGASPGSSRPTGEVAGHSVSHLTAVEWRVTQLVEPDQNWYPSPGLDARLRIGAGGQFTAQVCNSFEGTVEVAGDQLRFTEMISTLKLCRGERGAAETVLYRVLDGRQVRWSILDEELRIDGGGSWGLRLRAV